MFVVSETAAEPCSSGAHKQGITSITIWLTRKKSVSRKSAAPSGCARSPPHPPARTHAGKGREERRRAEKRREEKRREGKANVMIDFIGKGREENGREGKGGEM